MIRCPEFLPLGARVFGDLDSPRPELLGESPGDVTRPLSTRSLARLACRPDGTAGAL